MCASSDIDRLDPLGPVKEHIADHRRAAKRHFRAIAVMATLFLAPGPSVHPGPAAPPVGSREEGCRPRGSAPQVSPPETQAAPPRSAARTAASLALAGAATGSGHLGGRGPRRTGAHRRPGPREGGPALPRRRGRHREVQRGQGAGGRRHPRRGRPDRRGRPPHGPPQHRPARPGCAGHRAVPLRLPRPRRATGALLRPRHLPGTRRLPRSGGRPAERAAARHQAAGVPDRPGQGPRRPGERTPRRPPRRTARAPHRDPHQTGRRPQAAGHPDRRAARRPRAFRRRPARRRPRPRRPLHRPRRPGLGAELPRGAGHRLRPRRDREAVRLGRDRSERLRLLRPDPGGLEGGSSACRAPRTPRSTPDSASRAPNWPRATWSSSTPGSAMSASTSAAAR